MGLSLTSAVLPPASLSLARAALARAALAGAALAGLLSVLGQPALAGTLPAPASSFRRHWPMTVVSGQLKNWDRAVLLACDSSASTVRGCNAVCLRAIDAARAVSGLGPLVLPHGYWHSGGDEQLVEVTNAERVSRGLPPWGGPVQALAGLAARAVTAESDPTGPARTTWVSNFASGVLTVLQADYEWMYADGPRSANSACTAPMAPGCWQHKANILQPWPGKVGTAEARSGTRLVLAELMVKAPAPSAPR